ncbi:hypothetical protein K8T06_13325 [bacterium]|nr:hypothetical protein [bacterium]
MCIKETKEIKSLSKIRYWSELDALRVLEICEGSHLTMKGFCREHNIGYKRVQWWKSVFKKQKTVPEFVEITASTIDLSETLNDSSMEIILENNRIIRLHPGFNSAAISQLIDIVGG